MKKNSILLTFAFLFIANFSSAQFGVLAGYKTMKADNWFAALNQSQNTNVTSVSGINFGVDYWFRLKNYRIEFTPELSYEKYEQSFPEIDLTLESFNIYFNTSIYFLDLEGDCNCPTFSKDGNFLTKGLFLQVSPGWAFWNNAGQLNGVAETNSAKTNNFGIGVGLGVDFGISDLITITPIARFYYLPSVRNEALLPIVKEESIESNITQLYAGLKVGIRWKQ